MVQKKLGSNLLFVNDLLQGGVQYVDWVKIAWKQLIYFSSTPKAHGKFEVISYRRLKQEAIQNVHRLRQTRRIRMKQVCVL